MLIKLEEDRLAKWIIYRHFVRFKDSDIKEISTSYLGVYSNHPTSWMAVLARNLNKSFHDAVNEEKDEDLVRVPAMRKSKFILSESIGEIIFKESRKGIEDHRWRLKDVGLTIEDYEKKLPKLRKITKNNPLKLNDIRESLELSSKEASAIVKVATYMGAVLRIPSDNPWSNRWMYKSAPDYFEEIDEDKDKLREEIAKRYVENYGPVTIEDLAWWMGTSIKKAASLMEKINVMRIDNDSFMSKESYEEFLDFSLSKEEEEIIRFLPDWDPLLMGYAPNSKVRKCLGLYDIKAYDSKGNGCSVIFIGCRAVALWKVLKKGKNRVITLEINKKEYEKYNKLLKEKAKEFAGRIDVVFN
ncbi:Winged helix DNA-binding domain-containing protein [Clostridium sp. DSM 8431]|uniref:DNA glycosylase AlkZ-like family protein n=1 Tax=Clostridium sp. DSM 8431 TaxID=1761781 RepID=UPI0008E7BDA2|nr:crosslink repair DNA glycosylase YcaQ family protein [Clostridium sp. DSM 8431]SFU55675.1 Winged helix DNA-binding domain-containing protein [Clostridium sp. DSM 8431]